MTTTFQQAAAKQWGARPVAALEITLNDGSVKRYATEPLSSPAGFYEPRLILNGELIKEIDVLGHQFKTDRIDFRLANHDHLISQLIADNHLYNRPFVVKVGFDEIPLGDYVPMVYGKITDISLSGRTVAFAGQAATPAWPQLPDSLLTKSGFAGIPASNVGKAAPFILGKLETEGGAVPLLRVSDTRFIVAGHPVVSVDKVYKDGAQQTSGFTVKRCLYENHLGFYSCVDFDSNPGANALITADARGLGKTYITLQRTTSSDYALDLDGAAEYAYKDNHPFMSSDTDFTVQFLVKPIAHSGDGYIFGQEHYNQGGGRGFGVGIDANEKIWFTIANDSHNGASKTTASTAISTSAWTRVTASYNHSTKAVKIFYGDTQKASATLTEGSPCVLWKKGTVGAVWRNDTSQWINFFGGQIRWIRYKEEYRTGGDEISTGDADHAYEFEQNLNDSAGSSNLTGVNIDAGDYTEVIETSRDRLTISPASSSIFGDSDASAGLRLRFSQEFLDLGSSAVLIFRTGSSGDYGIDLMIYGNGQIKFSLYSGSSWTTVLQATQDTTRFEAGPWYSIAATYDIANQTGDIYLDDTSLAPTVTPLSSWNSDPGAVAWLYVADNGAYSVDVDYLFCAGFHLLDHRYKAPTPADSAEYWEFAGALDGAKGDDWTVDQGAPTYSNVELNNGPAEDIRDILHILGESVDHQSFDTAKARFDALGYNSVGQWGGLIAKSVGAREDARDVLRRLCSSCDSIIFPDPASGRWRLKSVNFDSIPAGELAQYRSNTEILHGSFSITMRPDLVNYGHTHWKRLYKQTDSPENSYEKVESMEIPSSIEQIGKLPADPLELDFVRGDDMAETVALSWLKKYCAAVAQVSFNAPLLALNSERADVIKISHPEGPSSDGSGYGNKQFILERTALNPESLVVQVRALEFALPEGGTFGSSSSGGTEDKTYELSPSVDTHIRYDYPTSHYGSSDHMLMGGDCSGVGKWWAFNTARAMLRFALPAVPSGSQLLSATFDFYCTEFEGLYHHDIYRLDSTGWSGASTKNNFDGEAWNDNKVKEIWGSTPGNWGPQQITINQDGRDNIQSQLNPGGAPGSVNIVFDPETETGRGAVYASNEHSNSDYRPRLTLLIRQTIS